MTLLILDGPPQSSPQGGNTVVIQWSGGDRSDGEPSLPLMVEEHAVQLRAEFLSWVYELGEYRLGGQTLREALQIDGNCSLWWSTLLAEKSPQKCPAIYTVFKLRMLERFVTANAVTELWLHSPDRKLAETISLWCRSSQRAFKWTRLRPSRPRRTLRDRFDALPHLLQAAFGLGRRLYRRARAGAAAGVSSHDPDAITVVSYFPNIDMRAFRQGRFLSNYWGSLQDLLDSPQRLANWILLFEPNEALSYSDAVRFCRRANADNLKRRLFLVESFLSASGVWKALRAYSQLAWRSLRMSSLRAGFVMQGSALNFWPILAGDWRSSTYGLSAMEACLWREAFRSGIATLGSQARGLYLFENQIWERNLITAWSESGANGPLIGYQHSFPKFMDSRLFEDPCAYALTGDPPPLPDVLATCGPAAFEVMEQSGFPASRLRTVEAVRYDYLRHHGPTDRSSLRTEERTLLVLGSIGHHESRDLLALLAGAAAAGALSTFPRIMAKSHPNMPLRPIIQDVCADIQITETQEPLSRLWAEVDMVVCANSTTACIEALWIGKPVVALGGRRSLNLNPLFRVGRMPFVNSVEELVSALQRPVANTPSAALFHFSPGLTEWRKLLAETGTRDVLQPQALYRSAQVLSRRSRTP